MHPIEDSSRLEIQLRVAERISSRNYWVFIPGEEALRAIADIRRIFYSGKGSKDFEMAFGPGLPPYGIIFAHKRRLSARKLAEFMRTQPLTIPDGHVFTAIDFEQNNVLYLAEAEEAYRMQNDFLNWISPALTRARELDSA